MRHPQRTPRLPRPSRRRSLLGKLGPGFITGASDDDPSGIGTYSQTGAQFGYHQLWTALFSLPFMMVVQEMCGRIGLVTGTGLAGNIRRQYSKGLLYVAVALLFLANTINIGADLGAMASSAQLLIGLPFEVLLLGMTALTLLLEVFVSYKVYAKFLKYLAFSLLAYVLTAFVIRQPWGEIAYRTFVPHVSWSQDYLMNIVAILGTTISPYLYFWQADEEVEEEVAAGKLKAMGIGKPKITKRDVQSMQQDTIFGMFFSNLVMFFIIMTVASTLGAHGITNIETATEAAGALRPLAGDFAFLLFAVGIIGTGLLTVPVLAGSASYALAESFQWKEGLYLKFHQAHGFYGAISIATVLGLVTNFIGVAPFKMLYYTAILNGLAAPPLLVLILLMSNNRRIMGEYTNSLWSNVLGCMITAIMGLAALALLFTYGT
jgi:NRAMP (natural resistance-associated macrophage protein)-like metal ion transporter